jgi:HD-GYP domain-containing protein (c-di-GMP phosphodiesterase class II)
LYTGEAQLSEVAHAISPLVADAIVTKADGNQQLPLALSGLRAEYARKDAMAEARKLALSLVSALSAHDGAGSARIHIPALETLDHVLRVARAAHRLGQLAGLSALSVRELELGALLHDVGMSCMPEALLRYLGPYEAHHWQVVRRHPQLGAELLRDSQLLVCALPVVLHHHEAFDGSGYPHGLAGENIPLAARLFAVLDTWEALTHPRLHAPRRTLGEARAELLRSAGGRLDPYAVKLFLGVDPDEWKRPTLVPTELVET